MSGRTRVFVVITAALGVAQLASIALDWEGSDPKLFLLYLGMAVVCGCFQVRGLGVGMAISLNLPLILLSIVQLGRSEAVVVGCAGILAQCLWDPQTRSRPSQIALRISILATVIATADFAYESLIPQSMRNETLLLIVASAALFFANTFPAAIVLRLSEGKRIGKLWKESYFWLFPYYLVAAVIAKVFRITGRGISLESALLVLPVLYLAYRYYNLQRSRLKEKEQYADDIAGLHLRAIEGLALAVEAKDNLNTRGHLRRVQVYALGLGKDLGLSAAELEALHAAALLHDIGKLAVPEHILTKPGKLTAEEFARMKVHPLVGAEIVEQVRFPYPVAPIVRAHHEKWDGSGYPFGLKGDEIPFGARILTVADCLDAMTSDREYRRALPLDEAMQQIAAEAGKSFDPRVVEILERRYRELDKKARASADQLVVLSTNVMVENGKTPGAGLDLCSVSGFAPGAKPPDFLGAIAAAKREGKVLLEMAQEIGSSLNLDETLRQVEQSLRLVIPFEAMAVFLNQGNTLIVQHASGENKEMLSSLQVPVGEGLTGWVVQQGRPVVNGNPGVDPGFVCKADTVLNACLAVPLEGTAGLLGVIALYRRDKDSFTRDHLRILTDASARIGVAIGNALRFREMEVRANTDSLTGLPNASLLTQFLESELARARRHKEDLCVMVCKLSGLPSLTQRLGQDAADQVLQCVATGMKNHCRKYDYVARIGDDRFALVLPGMRRRDVVSKVARLDAIVAEAAQPGSDHRRMVRFIFGEAFYPDDADGAKPLLAIAVRRLEQHPSETTEGIIALDTLTREPAAEKAPVPVEKESGQPTNVYTRRRTD